ncbi:hypothetical protein CO151_08550 [bacterium CG_4_9_14_3_um_filter_65_15]|nr:MAG: hypothetical protein CO151_08550 [bacterium CG_4_9_14_3_um_filter_65_15]
MAMSAIFLMCSERSGSNLITRMFDAHRDCCGPSPSHLIRVLAENRHRYGDLSAERNWETLLQDAADLLATKLGSWRRDWTTQQLRTACPERDLKSLVRTVFGAEAAAAGKRRLFIKENHLYRYLPWVAQAFPGLKIVAMVRDPRDMALSWKHSPILRGDAVRAADIWWQDQMHLLRVIVSREYHVHLLRYEDLIREPEAELQAVCRFANLEWDSAMTAFSDRAEASRDAARTDDWKNLDRPVMNGNYRKWATGLSPTEAAYVEAVCAEPMEALGYRREMDDPRTAEALAAELLPLERHEKPGWQVVPATEKELRGARTEVLQRIRDRVPATVEQEVPVHA